MLDPAPLNDAVLEVFGEPLTFVSAASVETPGAGIFDRPRRDRRQGQVPIGQPSVSLWCRVADVEAALGASWQGAEVRRAGGAQSFAVVGRYDEPGDFTELALRRLSDVAEPAPTGITLAASEGVDAASITIPTTAQAGDLAIVFDRATRLSGLGELTPFPPPTGWTQVISDPGLNNDAAIQAYAKILEAGDPGTAITPGDHGSHAQLKTMLVFRQAGGFASFTVRSPQAWEGGGDPPAQTIPASAGVPPLIVLASYGSANDPASASFVPTADGEILNGHDATTIEQRTRYRVYESAPADTTVDMANDGARNSLMSLYLEVA